MSKQAASGGDGDGGKAGVDPSGAGGQAGIDDAGSAGEEARAAAARVQELERDLAEARRIASEVRQERAAQQALHEAGVIDLEAGVLLIRQRLGAGEATAANLADAVKALRRSKPALFRGVGTGAVGMGATTRVPSVAAMPAATEQDAAQDTLTRLGEHAMKTGDRRSLLEYLRLRRGSEGGGG